MHASRLVEVAAIASAQYPILSQHKVDVDHWAVEQFWSLSRSRVNEWSRLLKACQLLRPKKSDFDPHEFWTETAPVIEEIFLSEVCTRVWCAMLALIDEQHYGGELDPVARSVFVTNLEARRRALRLLLFARGLPNLPTSSVNLLRRDCEMWTDSFLALLTPIKISQQFCFDRQRISDLGRRNKLRSAKLTAESNLQRLGWIRYGLIPWFSKPGVCAELNTELCASILGCFPSAAFDGCGIPRQGWSDSMFQSDSHSLNVLEDLCGNLSQARYDVPGSLKDRR